MRSHGGGIAVRSKPGAGHDGDRPAASLAHPESLRGAREARGSPASKWQGGGTVLVVDDEPLGPQAWPARSWPANGFAVARPGTASRGSRIAFDPGIDVDVVVLDVTMPEMDGKEALAAICARRPDLPVLLSSGYPPEEVVLDCRPGEPTEFLKKPYGPSELLEAVAALLQDSALERVSEREIAAVAH